MNEKDEATSVNEETESPAIYDDDNDPEWDGVKWDQDDDDDEDSKESIDDGDSSGENQPEEKPAETDGPAEKPANEAPAPDADQYLELKHFDSVRKVGKEEAKELAQKGLDYDRIRGERDSLKAESARYKDMEAFLNEMKGDAFSSVEDFMDDTRARLKAEKDGTDYSTALAGFKAARTQQQQEAAKPSPVDQFIQQFPDVKAENIPQSVWAEVSRTGDLVGAYRRHLESEKDAEIKRLKDEVEALKQNQQNKERSTGSSRSAGKSNPKTLVETLWDDGD